MDAPKPPNKIYLELSEFPPNTSTDEVEDYLTSNGFCKEVKSIRFKNESNNTICYVSLVFDNDIDDINIDELIEAIYGTPFKDNQIKAKKCNTKDKPKAKKPLEKDPIQEHRAPMIFDNEDDPLPISIPKSPNENDKAKIENRGREKERDRNKDKERDRVKESDRDKDHYSRRDQNDRDRKREKDRDRGHGSDHRKDRHRH